MKNSQYSDTIYPGSYVPFLKDYEMEQVLNRPHHEEINLTNVDVVELNNEFKVEMSIPAAKRENLFVHADNNVVSVCVLRSEGNVSGEIDTYMEDYGSLDRRIVLPENADAEFISAEYKDGVLCMYAPKSKKQNHDIHTTIAVY